MKGLLALCTTIFLLYEAKLPFALGSCPTYYQPDELQGSAVSLTRTASFNKAVCSDASGGSCSAAVDGLADGARLHQWQTSASHGTGHWFQLHFHKLFRVNKMRFKQLSTDYKQIKDMTIRFTTGAGSIQIQLSLQTDQWQSFRFSARKVNFMHMTVQSFYTSENLAYGYQEIEVFEENAGK
ncbi:Hypothetical predicted protein, partial [Paramuricea clavata]